MNYCRFSTSLLVSSLHLFYTTPTPSFLESLLTVALMILYMRLKSRTKEMERFERLYAQKKRQEYE